MKRGRRIYIEADLGWGKLRFWGYLGCFCGMQGLPDEFHPSCKKGMNSG